MHKNVKLIISSLKNGKKIKAYIFKFFCNDLKLYKKNKCLSLIAIRYNTFFY